MSRFMKYLSQGLAVLASGCGLPSSAQQTSADRSVVAEPGAAVVELFTSQGCSSCPPADRVLTELAQWSREQQRPVYCLSFHVDYWNQLGWSDPYGDKAFSARQRAYASAVGADGIYTPQLIINGEHALVGSNRDEAFRHVQNALAGTSRVDIKLSAASDSDRGDVRVLFEAAGQPPSSVLNLALVQKAARNEVPRGENAGSSSTHVNVVRAFKTVKLDGAAKGEATLPLPAKLSHRECEVIAYVQDEKTMRIIGAGRVTLGATP